MKRVRFFQAETQQLWSVSGRLYWNTIKALVQTDIPLAPFTTFKIGGPARFFSHAETEQQVIEAFDFASDNQLELFILGGGSNILISDKGFDGLVLHIALKGISMETQAPLPAMSASARKNRVHITAQAGEDWDAFVEYCVMRGLAGIECLSGIPGFVGGTPVQNVGAYGQEVSETIVGVRCFDRSIARVVELTNADCGFSYRASIFNTSMRDRFVVLSVTYSLTQGSGPKIVYKDLKDYFAEKLRAAKSPYNWQDAGVTLKQARDAVLRIRAAKSMVIDENDPNSQSAGSFFKNPIVPTETIDEIKKNMQIDDVPHFPVSKTNVKIPAAWLIEQAGFRKGFELGSAGISTRHTLAIANRGGASAKEILSLKNLIQTEVAAKFGIELQPEPVFIGFE